MENAEELFAEIRADGRKQIDTLIAQSLERAAHCDHEAKNASTVEAKIGWREGRDAWKEVAEVYSKLGAWVFGEAVA